MLGMAQRRKILTIRNLFDWKSAGGVERALGRAPNGLEEGPKSSMAPPVCAESFALRLSPPHE